jgi:hypothetical protein
MGTSRCAVLRISFANRRRADWTDNRLDIIWFVDGFIFSANLSLADCKTDFFGARIFYKGILVWEVDWARLAFVVTNLLDGRSCDLVNWKEYYYEILVFGFLPRAGVSHGGSLSNKIKLSCPVSILKTDCDRVETWNPSSSLENCLSISGTCKTCECIRASKRNNNSILKKIILWMEATLVG